MSNLKCGTLEVTERARLSRGVSNSAIFAMLLKVLQKRGLHEGLLVDIGCGAGNLFNYLDDRFEYLGVDAVRYNGFPEEARFLIHNLEDGRLPLPDGSADVVVAVETIEHLENPRAFVRELVRVAKVGGTVVVTTPNQLSLLSLLTLAFRGQFTMFQDCDYPAHLTALLEIDLLRIAAECRLTDVSIEYSRKARMFFTLRTYPDFLATAFPRRFSDNILLIGRKLFD